MPRNEARPLSATDHAVQTRNLHALQAVTEPVTVFYVKRDGSESQSTGKVAFFNGQPGMDTGSVTIDTDDKGPRTINLHRIVEIKSVFV